MVTFWVFNTQTNNPLLSSSFHIGFKFAEILSPIYFEVIRGGAVGGLHRKQSTKIIAIISLSVYISQLNGKTLDYSQTGVFYCMRMCISCLYEI